MFFEASHISENARFELPWNHYSCLAYSVMSFIPYFLFRYAAFLHLLCVLSFSIFLMLSYELLCFFSFSAMLMFKPFVMWASGTVNETFLLTHRFSGTKQNKLCSTVTYSHFNIKRRYLHFALSWKNCKTNKLTWPNWNFKTLRIT